MPLTLIEQVRLLIGDVDPAPDQVLTDAQIQFFLDTFGTVTAAAVAAATSAANILAIRATSERTGEMEVDYSKRAELFRQRAIDLQSGPSVIATCYVGGISQAELDAEAEATPKRAFRVGLHDDEEP